MEYEDVQKILPVGKKGEMKLGLKSIKDLMAVFDNCQDKIPTIHIAGTNGKGSAAMTTATILEKAGYKVGLYTSPHLVEFNERIQINRQPVSDDRLTAAIHYMARKVEGRDLHFSEFETYTCLAWLIFYHEKVDFAVLEVGLGGRLDATNAVRQPRVTAIMKIAKDHQKILGHTLAEIAYEKAGIIKKRVPVVVYPQDPEAEEVIINRAEEMEAPYTLVKKESVRYLGRNQAYQTFNYKGHSYHLALKEDFQMLNAAVVIEIIERLRLQGYYIPNAAVESGLRDVSWPARFEVIGTDPVFIVDGSHNDDGTRQLARNLKRYYPERKHLAIVGMLADKDTRNMLANTLPYFDQVITLRADSDRALTAEQLAEEIIGLGLKTPDQVQAAHSIGQALNLAEQWAGEDPENQLICCYGSFYMVGFVRQAYLKRQN